MADLVTEPAEVHMTLSITRAATGKTEEVHLVGHVIKESAEQPQQPVQEADHGSNPQ